MSTIELQNHIIKKILDTKDIHLLEYLNSILDSDKSEELYHLSEFEKTIIQESISDYEKGNIIPHNEVFSRNKKWLEE